MDEPQVLALPFDALVATGCCLWFAFLLFSTYIPFLLLRWLLGTEKGSSTGVSKTGYLFGTYGAYREGAVTPRFNAATGVMAVLDLDETLTGDDQALAKFNAVWETKLRPNGGCLVYNTARHIKAYLRLVSDLKDRSVNLLVPDYLATGDGSEIRKFTPDGVPTVIGAYTDTIRRNWDTNVVASVCRQCEKKVRECCPSAKVASEAMSLISKEFNFKTCDPSEPFRQAVIMAGMENVEMYKRMVEESLDRRTAAPMACDVRVFYNGGILDYRQHPPIKRNDWYFVNTTPTTCGKGNAARFLAAKEAFPPDRVFVCGDSESDRSMMASDKIATNMCAVGNCRDKLREFIDEQCAAGRNGFISKQNHALAVLDGLVHFGFLRPEQLVVG